MNDDSLISGWWVFAGVLLLIAGVLNIVYGIAAIGDSKFFTENATFIISGLHTWGWISLIIGVLELIAAFSLFSGGRIRPLVRDLRRLAQRDRRAALDPGVPLLVAGDLRPLDHHRLQAGRGPGRQPGSQRLSSTDQPRSGDPETCCGRRPRDPGAFVVSAPSGASASSVDHGATAGSRLS